MSATRFYELLEALKNEYELHAHAVDTQFPKMTRDEYEIKSKSQSSFSPPFFLQSPVQQYITEMAAMQRAVSDLEKAFIKMKQE